MQGSGVDKTHLGTCLPIVPLSIEVHPLLSTEHLLVGQLPQELLDDDVLVLHISNMTADLATMVPKRSEVAIAL